MSTIDLRIDSIAAGGDGVGRYDGLVVFVPRTAPGDVARVEATQHGRLMRGALVELKENSAQRTTPRCAHYVRDRCGGCQLQHLTYDAQLQAKSTIVRDAMTRIARAHVAEPAVEPSVRQWRYRTKLTLAFRRAGSEWIAGLHRFDAPDEVFALEDCPITDERVMAHWRSVLSRCHLLPEARELRAAIRLAGDGFSFSLEGGRTWPIHAEFFDALPSLEELWWTPMGQRRRRLGQRTPQSRAGASFVQVNPHVADALRQWVGGVVNAYQPRRVVDAYAGTGDTAVLLATAGMQVTAIEIDRDAARVCAARLPDGSRSLAAPVETALATALPTDVVILNPPRAGVDARVTQTLRAADHPARAVIYVSCNPATLARDVRRMDGWHVQSLRAFDMFPQTAHVETVCELVPAG